MDPTTIALLIKTAGELAALAIQQYRHAGANDIADDIEAILSRSDALATSIIDIADQELDKLGG